MTRVVLENGRPADVIHRYSGSGSGPLCGESRRFVKLVHPNDITDDLLVCPFCEMIESGEIESVEFPDGSCPWGCPAPSPQSGDRDLWGHLHRHHRDVFEKYHEGM